MTQRAATLNFSQAAAAVKESGLGSCVAGGKGYLRALKTVHPSVPIQRCSAHEAHEIRNITDKVKGKDAPAVKESLRKITPPKT